MDWKLARCGFRALTGKALPLDSMKPATSGASPRRYLFNAAIAGLSGFLIGIYGSEGCRYSTPAYLTLDFTLHENAVSVETGK